MIPCLLGSSPAAPEVCSPSKSGRTLSSQTRVESLDRQAGPAKFHSSGPPVVSGEDVFVWDMEVRHRLVEYFLGGQSQGCQRHRPARGGNAPDGC